MNNFTFSHGKDCTEQHHAGADVATGYTGEIFQTK